MSPKTTPRAPIIRASAAPLGGPRRGSSGGSSAWAGVGTEAFAIGAELSGFGGGGSWRRAEPWLGAAPLQTGRARGLAQLAAFLGRSDHEARDVPDGFGGRLVPRVRGTAGADRGRPPVGTRLGTCLRVPTLDLGFADRPNRGGATPALHFQGGRLASSLQGTPGGRGGLW